MLIAQRFQGVQKHDIEVAGNAAMLEGIVQHEHLASEFTDRPVGRGDAIGVLHVRHARQFPGKFPGFVVRPVVDAITAADDSCRFALREELADDPFNQRCLARAAQGEVADADHGHIDAVYVFAPQS